MIDRSNGRAPKPVSARIARKALLGSTALIGVALATPALAQTVNPSGGGSVSGSGTASNGTGLGGGLVYQSTVYNGTVTVSGVTIANTSGNTTDHALALEATSGSLVVNNIGTNNLSTTRSGGTALRLGSTGSNISWGVSQGNPSSVLNLTGSYGLYARTTAGFVNIVDFGTTSGINSITANGTAVEGIHVEGSTGANIALKTPAISGFQIGIRALTANGTASVSSTGGTITATATGIDADATAGDVTIDEAATITAPTGIDAEATGNITVTNRGTIDASGTPGYGIRAIGGGTVSLTVNAAIGGTTPFSYGIWAQAGAASGNAIAVNANIYGTTAGIWTANGSTPFAITVASGRTVTGAAGAAIDDRAGSTITNNGTLLAASGVSSTAVNLWSGGAVTNNGTITSNDGYAFRTFGGVTSLINNGTISGNNTTAGAIYLNSPAATTVTLNAGSTVNGRIFAYSSANTGDRTVTVNGTLGGDYEAASGGDTVGDTVTLGATGAITGAVRLGDGDDTFNWNGGTLGSTLDGGAGIGDTLNVALGAGNSATLGSYSNFESHNLASGNLTVGAIPNGSGWTINGGALTLDGDFTSTLATLAQVNSGGTYTLAAGRTTTGGNLVTAGGTVNIHGSMTGWTDPGMGSTTSYAAAIQSNNGITLTNDGTIQTITENYVAGVLLLGGSNVVTNSGLIAGGSDGNNNFTNAIRLGTGGLVTNQAGGTIRGAFAIENVGTGGLVLNNSGTISAGAYAVSVTGNGQLALTNQVGGLITAGSHGIYFGSSANTASFSVSNAGTITGTDLGSFGVGLYSTTGTLSLTNVAGGIIAGRGTGVRADTTLNLVNRGVIGTGTVTGNVLNISGTGNAVRLAGANNTLVNSGIIQASSNSSVLAIGSITLTNASYGVITTGGSGYALTANAGATVHNYGTITASAGAISGAGTMAVNLYSGSSIGAMTFGSGNDTLSIYNGRGTAGGATTVNGIVYQQAGTLAAASLGAVDMGTGANTLALRGTGNGSGANGVSGSINLGSITGAGQIDKLDAGSWVLTGTASGVTAGAAINANGGILAFNGTSGLTGAITVNGGTIRALTAGAFGSGTITMVDPTIQYGATGTYANAIVLASVDPVGDPSRIQADAGVFATLSGLISQSGGTAQPLVFDGTGTVILTNAGNDYAGLTTISNGTVVQRNSASALGTGGALINAGAVLQIDNQTGGLLFTEGGTISGAGTLRFTGNAGSTVALGAGGNGATIISMAAGGLVDIQSGTVNGSTSGLGFWTGNLASLNIASGARFYTVEGVVQVDALTGSGLLYGGFGGTVTMTIGVANGSGTFSGNIANDPTSGGRVLALTKTGTGTQTLTGTNAYTGTTTISGGTLALSGAGTLSASTIVNNATFDISGHTGGVSIVNMTGTGATALGANTLTVTNAVGSYSGNITGTGGLVKQGAGTWTLTGTSNYSGGTTISAGTLGATTASLGTGAIVNNATLALGQSAAGTLSNDISGTGDITVDGAGRVTLAGDITNSGTLSVSGVGSQLTISGTRTSSSVGVRLAAGGSGLIVESTGTVESSVANNGAVTMSNGSVTLTNRGLITGTGATTYGIVVGATDLTITNAFTGTIRSVSRHAIYTPAATNTTVLNWGVVETLAGSTGNAVYLQSGSVTNNAGGTIRQQGTGGGAGIYSLGTLSVTNNGTITTASTGGYDGVTAQGALTLTNGGTITAATSSGVATRGAASSVTNSGTITGGGDTSFGYGVQFATGATGTILNHAAGLITAGTGGVLVQGSGTTVDNSGRIVATGTSSRGVYVQSGVGAITNQADATIVGRGWGITIANTGTVTNSGFIGGGTLSGGTSGSFTVNSGGYGIVMNGGSVTNNAGGSIIGGIYGVASGGTTAATIVNSGTITGTTAIFLTNNNADTVTLNAGSVTNGLIQLGGGNDTLNWNGGSFTSIDGSAGTDVFNVNLAGAATLDMANLTGFETYALNGGALTVNGVQGSGGGWAVTNASLTLGATAQSWVTGTGVTLTGTGSALTIADGGSLAGYTGNGVAAAAGTSVTNAGLIRSTGASYSGVLASGGTIENQSAGLIAADGSGLTLQTGANTVTNAGIIVGGVNGVLGSGVAQTLVNSGVIVTGSATDATTQLSQVVRNGTGDGVRFTAGGSVTNTGFIGGNANGVTLSGGAATLGNSGTIEGGTGWAVAVDAVGSAQLTNSGTITGGTAGAIQLTGSGTATVTLAAGSTTTGNIVSTGAGARTLDIGGTLNGSYDASGSTGTDIVRLRAGGSLAGANLGDGNDTFVYIGGAISGLVDGGAGEDKLFGDFGAGNSGTVSLANFTNFEVFGVLSGNLLLSGPSATPGAAIYAGDGPGTGGTITFDGTTNLTGDIYVNGGTIVANSAGAFGTGTIHLIDPTATFGATGTYANAISLEVATPSSSDPATLNTNAGVTATLTGAITTGTVAGVDPAQQLVIGGQGTIVLTNTANSWTGTTTINAGATLQGTSATISGSAIVTNGTLAYVQPASGTVAVNITGAGQVNVSGLAAGEELTFSGSNSVSNGLYVLDGSAVANTGTFSNNVFLSGGGAFRNGGTVNGSISNSGALAATVTNQAGGLVNGLFSAVSATGALNLTNESGATLQGKSAVIASGGANIINAGTISGNLNAGISLGAGGTIVNSGSIQGGSNTLGGWGVNSTGALSFTSQAGGTLGGTAGAITSNGATTIDLQAGSTTSGAIAITGANASSVTIAGSYTGAVTLGDGDDTLVLDSAASIGMGSTFAGGAGTDGLVLAGTGNASLDLGTLTGFESRTMNGTGAWTLTGTDGATAGWQVNSGTLAASGGSAVNDAALVTIAAAGTFQLLANEAIGNLAGTGTVQLDASTLTLTGAGGSFGGVIAGAGNLRIESGAGITLSGANTYTGQTTVVGTLTLGASDVLADASTLIVLAGGTLDLGANSDTVAAVALNGTLNGTGTLTAASYVLDGAAVNGNLGTGTVYSSGATTLNGTAAGGVAVNAGTLTLGAADRLADSATVQVDAGATLNLGAFDDTINILALNGTLAGAGTLTAVEYQLAGATVDANLGAGTLHNLAGISTLNGTAAGDVSVQAGTLALGAADRLADTATVVVASSASLDIGAFSDTIGLLALNGTLSGSGALTAAQYQLTGATVDANLGAGTLFNLAGTSTLNGTAGGDVSVQGGTLALGAANRLADSAAVAVAAGATLDIGAYNDTVGALGLSGTLAGTGTLTALEYQLTGATVNANLGAGTLFQIGGTSTLNGTAAGDVSVQGGTLALGASNRLADAAAVAVAAGATLDIGAYNDTVGALGLNGTLAGSGTLTASQYQLTGAVVNANLGVGTVFNLGGTSTLNGTAGGDVSVQGGTLALGASNRLADAAIVAVSSGATLDVGAYGDTVAGLALNGTLAGTGTFTAAEYALTGATVNANLGAGTLFQVSGASTLSGSSAASAVQVQGGTLALGASNRLADTATVAVASGATLDLGANSDTVGALGVSGTLAGTGTLTAAQVQLNGATVNANLGAGTLANVGGTSTLTGSSAAGTVLASAGTLRLGASERLANTAILGIDSGATFDLAGYTETIGSLSNGANGGGTLALGAGRLVVTGNADAGFSGNIIGSGIFEKQGTGRLTLAGTLAMTGRIDLTAGTLVYSASSQGGMRVQGGTLIGGGSLAGPLTLASGTLSPGGLGIGLLGTTINPIGNFTVGSLNVSGGSLLFDFGGQSLNFASDTIRVTGAATLSGGTVAVNALTSAASDYRFNQLYVLVQANSLTGTFANGTVFDTVASNPNLKWRLRYDLMANAVVLQVQKNMEFTDGVPAGDANTLAVANALSNSTTGNATDEWAATLNSITALGTAQRIQAFRSFSGEALADLSTATIAANNLFTGLLRQRVGDGDDSLVGGGFGDTSLAQVRATTTSGTTFASRLASADAPEGRGGSGGGIWGQAYGGYQHLLGTATRAGFEATTAGVAMGAEVKQDGFTAGVAGGVAQIDGDVNSRNSTLSGTQYQLGGYVSYDSGSAFVSASGSWYSGDFDSKRTLSIGSANSLATGDIHSDGYSFGATAGFRAELGNGLKAAVIASAAQVHDSRDGFTENATGGLGLQVGGTSRDLFTATGEVRLGATVKTGSGFAMPWVSMGVRYNSGDLDALGNMRFAGAPTGTGSFIVEGARMAPVLGTLGVGIDARASKNVRLGIALEGAAGENSREGKASIRVKIGF